MKTSLTALSLKVVVGGLSISLVCQLTLPRLEAVGFSHLAHNPGGRVFMEFPFICGFPSVAS